MAENNGSDPDPPAMVRDGFTQCPGGRMAIVLKGVDAEGTKIRLVVMNLAFARVPLRKRQSFPRFPPFVPFPVNNIKSIQVQSLKISLIYTPF